MWRSGSKLDSCPMPGVCFHQPHLLIRHVSMKKAAVLLFQMLVKKSQHLRPNLISRPPTKTMPAPWQNCQRDGGCPMPSCREATCESRLVHFHRRGMPNAVAWSYRCRGDAPLFRPLERCVAVRCGHWPLTAPSGLRIRVMSVT